MRRPTKIVLSVLAATAVVCCGGGLIAAKVTNDRVKEATITPQTYNAVQVGQPEDQVRKMVDRKGSTARDELGAAEPPIPAGARCSYALSSRDTGTVFHDVYRFCFTGGKLVEKREIPVVASTGK